MHDRYHPTFGLGFRLAGPAAYRFGDVSDRSRRLGLSITSSARSLSARLPVAILPDISVILLGLGAYLLAGVTARAKDGGQFLHDDPHGPQQHPRLVDDDIEAPWPR
jgi:hypothetical protein